MASTNNSALDTLPFHGVVDYDIEIEFESSKSRIEKLMSDHGLLDFIKSNQLSEMLNPDSTVSCEYYCEDEFTKLKRNGPQYLNMFYLNIVSLPKHGGELVNFINSLETNFQAVVLSEIGARNISTVQHLFNNYTFYSVLPDNNNYGGVGIYLSDLMSDVQVTEEYNLKRSCNCYNCNFESLFINFTYRSKNYTLAGIYNHPRGNISHFIDSLDRSLDSVDRGRTVIIAGDININILQYEKKTVLESITLYLSKKFLLIYLSHPASLLTPLHALIIFLVVNRRIIQT